MTNHHDPQRTDRISTGDPDAEDLIVEPENSTVDDWFGQDVERDRAAAEEAVRQADGDLERAEEIFEQDRPEHRADRFNVPADERPA